MPGREVEVSLSNRCQRVFNSSYYVYIYLSSLYLRVLIGWIHSSV